MKRPQPKKTGGLVGVAWYREADWPRIKELFPDADKLHDSHAEWLKFAEDSVRRLRRTGVTVEPFSIDIDDFLGRCLVHGPRDAKARTEYVTEKLSCKIQPSQICKFSAVEMCPGRGDCICAPDVAWVDFLRPSGGLVGERAP